MNCLRVDDGREVIAEHQASNPGDSHLTVVLCRYNGKFVTWTYNKESGGYGSGNYFDPRGCTATEGEEAKIRRAFTMALEDFQTRVNRMEGI